MGSALLRKKNNYTFDGVRERVQLVCKSSGDVAPNGLCAGPDLGPFIIVHRLAEIFSHDVANLKFYFKEPRRQSLRLRTAFNLLLPILPPNERKIELVWEFVKIHLPSTMVAWHDSLRPFIARPGISSEIDSTCRWWTWTRMFTDFSILLLRAAFLHSGRVNKFKPFYDKIYLLNVR